MLIRRLPGTEVSVENTHMAFLCDLLTLSSTYLLALSPEVITALAGTHCQEQKCQSLSGEGQKVITPNVILD